jgi:hypothetical protein
MRVSHAAAEAIAEIAHDYAETSETIFGAARRAIALAVGLEDAQAGELRLALSQLLVATAEQSEAVSALAVALVEALGLPRAEREELAEAA